MHLLTFTHEGRVRAGRLAADGSAVEPFELDTADAGLVSLVEWLDAGNPLPATAPALAPGEVRLLAPIPRPRRNIFCVGKNYAAHAAEFTGSGFDLAPGAEGPDAPIIFSKVPQTVIAPGERICFDPAVSEAIDYEVELAVVIGRGGRGISAADAPAHVFGYTIINDVTARDVQRLHKQWLLGKSFDTFCPMGPYVVSADSVDAGNLDIRCWINGELRQQANTRDLIFDVPALVETISRYVTLVPGDVIATGTPAGVGIAHTPPKFLRHGDRVRMEIAGIGVLENVVEAVSTPNARAGQ